MPIDYKLYPKNWLKEIRPRILERDGHRCKFCGVADHSVGWWGRLAFYTSDNWAADAIDPDDEDLVAHKMAKKPAGSRVILTIAHLDHGLSNHEDDNLAALCQRCHLNHDRKATAAKRKQSRRYSKRRKQLHFNFLT
jgi:5-methylcytosine-specific restriction endonuclease McrA